MKFNGIKWDQHILLRHSSLSKTRRVCNYVISLTKLYVIDVVLYAKIRADRYELSYGNCFVPKPKPIPIPTYVGRVTGETQNLR